ncbi:MAG: DUF2279 domain-containing protein [Deltaproteobacteria bacterium]|nr:DUF2279 domain-containing protein [Deltaproteobacteria bacterium]
MKALVTALLVLLIPTVAAGDSLNTTVPVTVPVAVTVFSTGSIVGDGSDGKDGNGDGDGDGNGALEVEPAAPSAAPAGALTAPALRPANPWAVGGLTAGLGAVVILSGYLSWWDDGEFVPFTWQKTGWFGPDAPLGGGDKKGHFFSFYTMTRATAQFYRWVRVSDGWARFAGATFAFALGAMIETVDGFTHYGFEFHDVIANVTGIAVASLLEWDERLDRLLGVRMGFVPSKYFPEQIKRLETMNDYSGMSLHLDLRLAGLAGYGLDPGYARYLTVGLTYGTRDYGPDGPDKRRNLGVFVGLNLPELLDATLGRGKPGVEVLRTFTRYYAVPLTEVGLQHDLDGTGQYLNFGVPNRLEVHLNGD